jgi:hypothetical protein
MNFTKSIVKIAASSAALILSVLLAAEILLRIAYFVALTPMQTAVFNNIRELYSTMWKVWTLREHKDPFFPPFLVYSNSGSSDEARLRAIFENTRLPPHGTWISSDFLQPRRLAEETSYTIHSNSLGFRGQESTTEKPPGTYRIIALGAYQTFGHGVQDNETYPKYLQDKLNTSGGKRKFEVWNGGKHAATAIIALARLKNELLRYKPDMLILDYGFVDKEIINDNSMPSTLLVPGSSAGMALRFFLQAALPVFDRSVLAYKILTVFSHREPALNKATLMFQSVMMDTIKYCQEHNIKVLLVRQFVSMPSTKYEPLVHLPGVIGYLDLSKEFYSHPPSDLEQQEFWKKKNWLNKIQPEYRMAPELAYGPYKIDELQLSPLGQQITAEALAKIVRSSLGK